MKLKLYLLAAIMLTLLCLASCRAEDQSLEGITSTPSAPPVHTAEPESATPEPSIPEEQLIDMTDPEFSFKIGDILLTLREQGIDEKIESLPYALLSDHTETLGEGSDTLTGSTVRTISYEGLELLLFAPKDNENACWIMQMTADDPGIETHRGIRVGDSLTSLRGKYPEAEAVPTESSGDIYRYLVDYYELVFHISEDHVVQIVLTYYIP